jgi:hypothetical protein
MSSSERAIDADYWSAAFWLLVSLMGSVDMQANSGVSDVTHEPLRKCQIDKSFAQL